MLDDIEVGINYEYINPMINIIVEESEEIELQTDSISQIIYIIKNMYKYILQKYNSLFYMRNKKV